VLGKEGNGSGGGGVAPVPFGTPTRRIAPAAGAASGTGGGSGGLLAFVRAALAPTLQSLSLAGTATHSRIVYPPCNTDALARLALGDRSRVVVSVGQFRPEKDHPLQLRAFADLRGRGDEFKDVKLVLIGGARGAEDEARVASLKALRASLGLGDDDSVVEFRVNVPLAELRAALGGAMAGLHTMWNEHFGIGVVEMMAAGVIAVAHNSGGPACDIVVPWDGQATGFLATTPAEYADALEDIFSGGVDADAMAAAARDSVARFSDEQFCLAFYAAMTGLLRDAAADARARREAAGVPAAGEAGALAGGRRPAVGALLD
jgi:alpha-1,2-mannosyltransferase